MRLTEERFISSVYSYTGVRTLADWPVNLCALQNVNPLFLVVAYVFRLVYNYEKIPISGAWDVWNTQDWKHHETGLINSEGCFLYVTALNHVSIRKCHYYCKTNTKERPLAWKAL